MELLTMAASWLMGNFNELPIVAQAGVLLVSTIVTISAHIAPYTKNTYDDKLAVWTKGGSVALVKKMFDIVAGNYLKSKNK